MDFTFSEEQEALRTAVRDFLARESPPAYWRSMIEDERGFSDDVWSAMVELGWVGLLVPEAQGGSGLGLVDLVVVMEEMGRVPFPGPFFSSAVLATLACPGARPRRSAPRAGRGPQPRDGRARRAGARRRGRPRPDARDPQVGALAAAAEASPS